MISYIALGANIGDRQATLRKAVSLINDRVGRVIRQSTVMETEPEGFISKNKFLNMCIAIDTLLSPQKLLLATQSIERELGRTTKTTDKYQDRLIDIDILLYENVTINEENLQIPHPRMNDREFVMKPLKEIMLCLD